MQEKNFSEQKMNQKDFEEIKKILYSTAEDLYPEDDQIDKRVIHMTTHIRKLEKFVKNSPYSEEYL